MKTLKLSCYWIAFSLAIILFSPASYTTEVPSAKEQQGLVIFYRVSQFKGKGIRFNINHAQGPLGQLLSGTYLYRYLPPGEHSFWSQAISQDSIKISVEAGKVYYIKGEVRMGVIAGRPKFSQVSEFEALEEIAQLN